MFCVPIFPISSKQVWVCAICQWTIPIQQGYVLTSFPAPLTLSRPGGLA
jgi:hypothetical protein